MDLRTFGTYYWYTVCPRSLEPFYIVSNYINWVKTSWLSDPTYSADCFGSTLIFGLENKLASECVKHAFGHLTWMQSNAHFNGKQESFHTPNSRINMSNLTYEYSIKLKISVEKSKSWRSASKSSFYYSIKNLCQ